jgi:hypothetical protein
MAAILSYKNLILDSSEIINISLEKSIGVVSTDTMALYEVTQYGVLKANRFNISANIRNNADTKFIAWNDLMNLKPTEKLTVWGRDWGDFLIEKMSIDVTDLAPDGFILQISLKLDFIQAINFV